MAKARRKSAAKRRSTSKRKSAAKTLHKQRFPNESQAYRTAREWLLKAEMELRRKVEAVAALIGEIVAADVRRWSAIASLLLTGAAVAVAAARTVRTAVRLGAQADTAEVQSTMARTIYRDHLMCLAAVGTTVILQTIFA